MTTPPPLVLELRGLPGLSAIEKLLLPSRGSSEVASMPDLSNSGVQRLAVYGCPIVALGREDAQADGFQAPSDTSCVGRGHAASGEQAAISPQIVGSGEMCQDRQPCAPRGGGDACDCAMNAFEELGAVQVSSGLAADEGTDAMEGRQGARRTTEIKVSALKGAADSNCGHDDLGVFAQDRSFGACSSKQIPGTVQGSPSGQEQRSRNLKVKGHSLGGIMGVSIAPLEQDDTLPVKRRSFGGRRDGLAGLLKDDHRVVPRDQQGTDGLDGLESDQEQKAHGLQAERRSFGGRRGREQADAPPLKRHSLDGRRVDQVRFSKEDDREAQRDRQSEADSGSQDHGEEKSSTGSQKAGGDIAAAATSSGAGATRDAAGMVCKQPSSGRFPRFAPRFGDLCAQSSSMG